MTVGPGTTTRDPSAAWVQIQKLERAEAAIRRARYQLSYMHQATTFDRRVVREALNEALAALESAKGEAYP